jgi:NTE family protein
MVNNKKFGLALSGGGYRATTYHIGTFRKLKELKLLDKIDMLSSNSGGSITGATYALHYDNYHKFESIILSGIKRNVILYVLTSIRFLLSTIIVLGMFISGIILLFKFYTLYGLLTILAVILLILFFQFTLFPFSQLNERAYNKFFFKKALLNDISSKIKIAINSTNLETGRLFDFAKNKMWDTKYEYDGVLPRNAFTTDKFPLARAVSASTAVPGIFTPIKINKRFYKNPNDFKLVKPRLVDGGVYDNQGLHKLTQQFSSYRCDIVVVSDAGDQMPFRNKYFNSLSLLFRTGNVFMNRIKNLQMIHQLFQPKGRNKREVAYQSLGWDVEESIPQFIESIKEGHINNDVLSFHKITAEEVRDEKWHEIEKKLKVSIDYNKILDQLQSKDDLEIARSVGTNLTPLSDKQRDTLISQAASMTEIQVKLYCPSLLPQN